MTTFQTNNVGLGLSSFSTEATTPTTPRAHIPPPPPPSSQAASVPVAENMNASAPNTPTNATFSGVAGQRPLPTSPFANSFSPPREPPTAARPEITPRGDSHKSVQSTEMQDVEMEDEDGEDIGSDAESVDAEGRPSKKKKGQRFFCTDFPPCKLSFTRSEHLARHIRKHTGERPFQCHCSRRFSRLDNLRQHAQTVHVNEEIPGDSLAATGTRFQRQIRTDRVAGARPNTSRPRTGTGPHSRGHSRNLSASSVGSMASTASTLSTMSRDDGRHRPPPLMMANDPGGRNISSLDVLRNGASTPPGQGTFLRDESEGISTPTSTTFSTGQNSPGGYGSSMGSPTSAVSRGGFWDSRSHARRLSVPSGPKPFQSPQTSYGSPYLSPLHSSNASNFSTLSSTLGSPTSSTYGLTQQHAAASREEEWRRRTWHPSSYTNFSRPATSGMAYIQTPGDPRSSFAPGASAAASQSNRLPGIETFDQPPRRPATPPGFGAAPTHFDSAGRPPVYPGPSTQPNSGPSDRMARASWDLGLHHGLTKLELSSAAPPPEAHQYPAMGMRPASEQMTQATYGPHVSLQHEAPKRPTEDGHYPTTSSNRAKRQGWYAGPPSASSQLLNNLPRTSPGDSSSSEGQPTTPSLSAAEHIPAIVHANGHVEVGHKPPAAGAPPTNYPPPSVPQQQSPWPLPAGHTTQHKATEMSGLDALVAVATREENSTATPHA